MKKIKAILLFSSLILLVLNLQSCKDNCEALVCQNGALCANGACQCPTGFSGDLCQIDDLCASKVCQNGGTCAQGICDCPPGHSGSNCENYDPCFNVTCQNAGVCDNGTCDCPPGYDGPDCSNKLTPEYMLIYKVDLLSYPSGNWDIGGHPDIFLAMNQGNTINAAGQFVDHQNEISPNDLPITYFCNKEIYTLNSTWAIGLYDADNGPAEYMAGAAFTPSVYTFSYFPSTITITGSNFGVKLYVYWYF